MKYLIMDLYVDWNGQTRRLEVHKDFYQENYFF